MTARVNLKLLHVASGDRWAGAEVQVYTLLTELHKNASLAVHAVILNEGELAARLLAGGVNVTVLDESRLGSLAILRELMRLLRNIQPEIIHSHRQKENVLVSIANFLSIRSKCLRTVHGAPEHRSSFLQLGRFLNQQADAMCGKYLQQRIVAVSADLGQQLTAHFPPSSVVVVKNGVNCEAIGHELPVAAFREEQPNAYHVGFAGRLESVKRVDLFIDMAENLIKNRPATQFCFHIFGDGLLSGQLQNQHRDTNLGDNLQFHGHRSDISACLASLDVLVMCSDHEGTPMTVLEAITLGTPVVAHHTGGLVELLENGNGGVLVKQHDAAGYAEAVFRLVENRQWARKLVAAGQRNLNEHYSASANSSQILAVYEDLLATDRKIA